jgi:hypothetical protein
MEFPVLRWMGVVACATMLVEDGKQEGAMVESTVLNGII